MAQKKRKLFFIDDTLENQDWIKARSFDFPGYDKPTLEATFGLNVPYPERIKRLREISIWPTMRNAPEWLRNEIDRLPKEVESTNPDRRANRPPKTNRTILKPNEQNSGQ